ncbi:hypothetical protein [Streptomyces sp. NPDC050535]
MCGLSLFASASPSIADAHDEGGPGASGTALKPYGYWLRLLLTTYWIRL